MANVVIFDEVTNRVLQYLKSVNTPDYSSRGDAIVNPDVSGLSADKKYWIHSGGSIREMTPAEKQAVNDTEIVKDIADRRSEANNNLIGREGQVIRALAEVVMDEINILRDLQKPSLPLRTLTQLKNAIKKKIDDGNAD